MPKHHDDSLQIKLRVLIVLATLPMVVVPAVSVMQSDQAIAQTPTTPPTFTLPNSLPRGTAIKVDGSSSMTAINTALKQRFQERFPGVRVDLAATGTQSALQSLLKGQINVAAIGRSLTAAETAQGLVEVPVSREKIAIIVGANNPFQGSLTAEQFAKIYRGEITNWSAVGGADAPIRVVDRPVSSDTRIALSQYPVFQSAPFKTGANATQVPEDSLDAVVKALGSEGISYGIASQVKPQTNVRSLPLHETLPDDPRYPFSQPQGYVYKGSPDAATQAFLGFATSQPGQAAVAAVATPVVPETIAASPAPVATPPEPAINTFPWGWLLLPLLGLPALLAWVKGRGVPPLAAEQEEGHIILTPRNCQDAYAYWEIPAARKAELRRQGGHTLALRLYDVTDISLEHQSPHGIQQFECNEQDQDRHLPIALDNRDYIAELGYLDDNHGWLRLARSQPVRVPVCTQAEKMAARNTVVASPQDAAWSQSGATADGTRQTLSDHSDHLERTPESMPHLLANAAHQTSDLGDATKVAGSMLVGGTAAIAGMGAATHSLLDKGRTPLEPGNLPVTPKTAPEAPPDCRIILVPRNAQQAYVYWEVADSYKSLAKQQGDAQLMLRIHDVTDIDIDQAPPHSTQAYPCRETDQDKHVPIPTSNHDYLAELGYLTHDNRWLGIARSIHVRVP